MKFYNFESGYLKHCFIPSFYFETYKKERKWSAFHNIDILNRMINDKKLHDSKLRSNQTNMFTVW